MTSQINHHTPFNEPSIVVNVSQTEVEADVVHLPYPPELSLKRQFSETVNPRGHFWKRRRTSGPSHGKSVDSPCVSSPPYPDATMSEPWSNLESTYSTLPSSPPSPDTPAKEHSHRLSVAELVEKVNAKLKRMFGSRKGSAIEDESAPPVISDREERRSSASEHAHGPSEPPNFQTTFDELLWNGRIRLPNVSDYFENFGEAGPISYYSTADWEVFQATVQAQQRHSARAELHRDMHYEADTDVGMTDKLRKYDTRSSEPEKRSRKDSHFSFSELWARSRRSSKVEKGKRRQLSEDEIEAPRKQSLLPPPPEHTSASVVLPLTEIGVLPRASTDGTSLLISKEPLTIPEADFSSSKSSIPSLKFSSPSSPKVAPTPSPNAQASIRLVTTPPPGRPEVRPASSVGSSPSSTSLSSVNSSHDIESPTPVTRPTRTQSRLAKHRRAAAGIVSSNVSRRRRSQPVSIPSPRNHLSTVAESSTHPKDPTTLRHGDAAPPSPPLSPKFIPSPEQMQALTLGTPERALPAKSSLCQAADDGSDSSGRLSHPSVEATHTPTRPAGDSDLGPSSSVRRRTGTNLREAYVEHEQREEEEEEELETQPPPRKISPRKSVGGLCWWGEEGKHTPSGV
jgi:hypothetical protein